MQRFRLEYFCDCSRYIGHWPFFWLHLLLHRRHVAVGIDPLGYGLTRIDFLSDAGVSFTLPEIDFIVEEDLFTDIAVHHAFGSDNAERMTYIIDSSAVDVPEPSTIVLAALGLVSMGFVALRKKYRRA